MEQTTLQVQLRTEMGKGPAHRLRAKGFIPAVLYRGSANPVHLALDPKTLEKSLRTGRHTLMTLALDGGGDPSGNVVMIKDLQRDPVYNRYMHAEFILIDLTKPMEIEVAVETRGTAPGVGLGGILQVTMRHIRVRCLPTEIPHHIEVDVGALNIGDAVHVKDLKMPGSVQGLEEPEAPVAQVVMPALEEKAKPVEGEEAAAAEGAEGEAPAEGGEEKKAGEEKKGGEKKGGEKKGGEKKAGEKKKEGEG